MVESYILECDVFDTGKTRARSDCSNRHPYSKKYLKVAHHDIFRALSQLAVLVHWLYSDSVVEIGDLHALNQDVLPRGVNAVSVQSVGWHLSKSAESGVKELIQLELAPTVDVDLKVMEVDAIHVVPVEMVEGRILNFYSGPLDVLTAIHVDQVGSAVGVFAHIFPHPPGEALAVNYSASLKQQVLAVNELPKGEPVADYGREGVVSF